MQPFLKASLIAPLFLGGLAGCVPPHVDNRLAEDQQTCQQMGHPAGSAVFRQCLAELNERRCALAASRPASRSYAGEGSRHLASEDCTRLLPQR